MVACLLSPPRFSAVRSDARSTSTESAQGRSSAATRSNRETSLGRSHVPLVVQSTDGDFLPLALVHCEAHAGRHVYLECIETRISATKCTASGTTKRRTLIVVYVCIKNQCA